MPHPTRPYLFYGATRALCGTCLRIVDAKELIQDGSVYLWKRCPHHGVEQVLLSDDASYYRLGREKFLKAPEQVNHANTGVVHGCPYDCGICPDHEQHGCVSILELTDQCNLRCPTCYANSGPERLTHRSLAQLEAMLDRIVANEGEPDVLQISGGEPTLQPRAPHRLWSAVGPATTPAPARSSLHRGFRSACSSAPLRSGGRLVGSAHLRAGLRDNSCVLRKGPHMMIRSNISTAVRSAVNSQPNTTRLAAATTRPGDLVSLNPQPLPPEPPPGASRFGDSFSINPQPLPPKVLTGLDAAGDRVSINPQPLPPKVLTGLDAAGDRVSINPQPVPPREALASVRAGFGALLNWLRSA